MDEVQTGFGRTGANFAHQLYGVKPDLMGCGKAAGGGILPVSFVAGRKDVIDTLTPGSEGSTFGVLSPCFCCWHICYKSFI